MKCSRVFSRAQGKSGFSLVEIMLALAVIAVGLIAVIGLIPRGIQASRDAADSTIIATIVHDTFNNLRLEATQTTSTFPPADLTKELYYDITGTNQTTSPSPDTYYHIHFKTGVSTPTLVQFAAIVTWPDKGQTKPPVNTNIFFTSLANYQQ